MLSQLGWRSTASVGLEIIVLASSSRRAQAVANFVSGGIAPTRRMVERTRGDWQKRERRIFRDRRRKWAGPPVR
ncbi:hypothetical protein M406DRAFT_357396 [Cryphonectria parasitica EP155]|uniref:Uncharacterized protein n=1 Tax=Cryphonectria parasitica (strain ATCC 38755 / EP155) TaxID=660469 RepID=A0A9P5CKJ1_CRYP1|nr:uncharacterized protein M406DRAFT_357396 [Cryphonectria parasitica EP155]KAF3762304.1 hypothetical protein M406DRAFT_357396 [Cryphonectria parasitica EP155]